VDPFGHGWSIATYTEDLGHEEKAKPAGEAISGGCYK
jgi:hypothetical protein